MTARLFIGGPKDGEWIGVDRPELLVTEILTNDPDRQLAYTDLDRSIGVKQHRYSAERIRFGADEATVYRHSAITIEEVLHKLLNNYKPSA